MRGLGDHGPSLVTSLQSAGWRKACAVNLVEYAEQTLAGASKKGSTSDWD